MGKNFFQSIKDSSKGIELHAPFWKFKKMKSVRIECGAFSQIESEELQKEIRKLYQDLINGLEKGLGRDSGGYLLLRQVKRY